MLHADICEAHLQSCGVHRVRTTLLHTRTHFPHRHYGSPELVTVELRRAVFVSALRGG